MKNEKDQSHVSTEDKWDDVLFPSMLLVHGDDPEPFVSSVTSVYDAWCNDMKLALLDMGYDHNHIDDIVIKYIQWLDDNGMGFQRCALRKVALQQGEALRRRENEEAGPIIRK